MRFSSHLSSHLTPEWKKHYIDYDSLKKIVYSMVGHSPVEELDDAGVPDPDRSLLEVHVDERIQDEFFERISRELETVNSFFRAREAEAAHKIIEYEEEVELLQMLRVTRRTRNLRSTRTKHRSLKRALSEFYYSLVLLQNFQQLNRTGFRKVLKKQDKLARTKRGQKFFKEVVCKADFVNNHQLDKLIEKTEKLMIDKLEDGNRSKAMNTLRVPPLEKRDVRSHWITFMTGLLMGTIAIAVVVAMVIGLLLPMWCDEDTLEKWYLNHSNPTLHGLRVGFILWLWFTAFAVNTYFWRRYGVNNILIFEFDPRNNLNFVELFAVSSLIGILVLVGVFLVLFSCIGGYPAWVGPLVMIGLMAIFFVAPVPTLFYRSRLWLANICRRIFMAPFCEVNFADFWIADQMNSLAVVFLDLELFFCYVLYGLHSGDINSKVNCGSVKYVIRPLVGALPAWFRFAQCLRRYWSTRKKFPHLVNAGKYSTSFFVIFFSSVANGIRENSPEDARGLGQQPPHYYVFFMLWVMSAIVSTCYTFTWDIKMDWGLFDGHHKLRKELIYPNKLFYWFGIVEDLIFRSFWTLTISVGEAGASVLDGIYLGTVLSALEVGRRFVWNFFRLENEHLNNCGQFRVIRDISVHVIDPKDLMLNEDNEKEDSEQSKLEKEKQRKLSLKLVELGRRRSGVDLGGHRSGVTIVGDYIDLQQLQEDRNAVGGTSSGTEPGGDRLEEVTNVGLRKTSILVEVIPEEASEEDESSSVV